MTSRNYPDFIQEYLNFTTTSEAPEAFHFWTAVSTIAGALRRQVWMDMGHFKWRPNFYIIFVAPPGIVSKSTTAGIGMSMLREIPNIHFGADSTTWQAMAQKLSESRGSFMYDGKLNVMCCLTIVASELGTLLNCQDTESIDALVSLWDSIDGPWVKATKTQGTDRIINPCLNLVGCTTPSWIGQNVPEYMIGGGFTSRTIFVYGEKKRRLIAYPDGGMAHDYEANRKKLIDDLKTIAKIQGQYTLTKEAREWGEAWYKEHHENPPEHLKTERYGGYFARKQTHIHKLAMVLAAAKGSDLTITQPILEEAAIAITETELDMPKVFAQIGANESARQVQAIIKHVRAYPKGITMSSLMQHFLKQMGQRELEDALKGAVASKEIKMGKVRDVPMVFPQHQ